MALNPWRLRLLADLATYGTVRAVAQRGNLSPSAVSQQLATLERETRTALIERTGRRVRLTAAGVLLAGRAREILAAMDAAEAELRGLADEPAGTVTVAAFQSAVHALAEPAVAHLAARHPDVTVVLLELEPHESMPALRRGDVDLIITTADFAGAELDPAIDLVPLGEDAIVLVLPPEHPLAGAEAVTLESCADQRWSFDVAGSYMSELATRLCREAGFEPTVICRFNNYMLALQHVENGRSIAMLPKLAVDPRYRVATRPLSPSLTRRITAAVRRPSTPRPEVTAVLTALRTREA
ncbi:DNA-binding transcriptional LysR family regulator [Actinoplanes lutulentus]|uniref:DNA-binding transcriptional LysR family regulator n=1 Tax=Actinoplanes lutulentus TaxID=1287878 RepID=A0A327YXF9_9ACTN|nr:LysR family transcriptional regulator [Actinoplanes lutulentus]MBB2947547.1 DNA-binding transcriptional LysR family regulator [Actinoplanes lutulentus]RAK25703.1 DNA-binding transcriptional LysR family regulator [Actinoplanes lutulentus]